MEMLSLVHWFSHASLAIVSNTLEYLWLSTICFCVYGLVCSLHWLCLSHQPSLIISIHATFSAYSYLKTNMALRALVFLASQALMSKLGKLALFFEAMFNIQCFVCEKREEKNESLQAEFR